MPEQADAPGHQEGRVPEPSHLSEGKNFYEQPPFDEVIARAAEQYKMEEMDLRHLVTKIARGLAHKTPEEKEKQLASWNKYNPQTLKKAMLPRSTHPYSSDIVHQAMHTLVGSLKPFSGWEDYIEANLTNGTYKINGDHAPSPATKQVIFPRFYRTWAATARSTEIGIVTREAFPYQGRRGDVRIKPRYHPH